MSSTRCRHEVQCGVWEVSWSGAEPRDFDLKTKKYCWQTYGSSDIASISWTEATIKRELRPEVWEAIKAYMDAVQAPAPPKYTGIIGWLARKWGKVQP